MSTTFLAKSDAILAILQEIFWGHLFLIFFRTHVHYFPEDLCEIRKIVEATLVTNFCHRNICFV